MLFRGESLFGGFFLVGEWANYWIVGGLPYPFPVEKTLKSYVYINVTSRVFIFLQLLNRTKVWLQAFFWDFPHVYTRSSCFTEHFTKGYFIAWLNMLLNVICFCHSFSLSIYMLMVSSKWNSSGLKAPGKDTWKCQASFRSLHSAIFW